MASRRVKRFDKKNSRSTLEGITAFRLSGPVLAIVSDETAGWRERVIN